MLTGFSRSQGTVPSSGLGTPVQGGSSLGGAVKWHDEREVLAAGEGPDRWGFLAPAPSKVLESAKGGVLNLGNLPSRRRLYSRIQQPENNAATSGACFACQPRPEKERATESIHLKVVLRACCVLVSREVENVPAYAFLKLRTLCK